MSSLIDPVQLTRDLVAIPSESTQSNRSVSDLVANVMESVGFTVEECVYRDGNDVEKVSLVGRKGDGAGGLGFFSHSDTVPGGEGWDPFDPVVDDERIVGRGSCDMKGPIAASIAAAAAVDPGQLSAPIIIAVTADEEIGHYGAAHIIAHSETLAAGWPERAIICEPTEMAPAYAHKGSVLVTVTAHGVAAHTSTDRGESATFKIAPFMAEMAELAETFRRDDRFKNDEFEPSTNGFNITVTDGGTANNVTAVRTVCCVIFRSMPDAASEEAESMILSQAKQHGLDAEVQRIPYFYTRADNELALAASRASNLTPATVPFGTEAAAYQSHMQAVVMGPGNIAQAHTRGEWITLEQLQFAVRVYRDLIGEFCQA